MDLTNNIQDVVDNIWKLYSFIYSNKALGQLNESLQFGHSCLREHLLVLSNLIVRDFQRGKILSDYFLTR